MKKIVIVCICLLLTGFAFAQKDSKITNYYSDLDFGEQSGVSISAKNVVSKTEYAKLGLEINNQSNDYVFFRKDECAFIISDNTYMPEKVKKAKIIDPLKSSTYTVGIDGQTNYLVDHFDFRPGGIYTFSSEGSVIDFEDFHLPPNRNVIKTDKFTLKMLKLKKETAETAVKFEIKYTGNKVAVIYPSNCVLKTENGKEWANARSNMKPVVLQKNEKDRFIVVFTIPGKITDMQFAEMDIVWKDMIRESDLKELNFNLQRIELDTHTTEKKN